MAMSKAQALGYADGSVNKLAEILDISHAAVSQWGEGQIPLLREYQLREYLLKPKKENEHQLEPEGA